MWRRVAPGGTGDMRRGAWCWMYAWSVWVPRESLCVCHSVSGRSAFRTRVSVGDVQSGASGIIGSSRLQSLEILIQQEVVIVC